MQVEGGSTRQKGVSSIESPGRIAAGFWLKKTYFSSFLESEALKMWYLDPPAICS